MPAIAMTLATAITPATVMTPEAAWTLSFEEIR
jgi:hypothetical protein